MQRAHRSSLCQSTLSTLCPSPVCFMGCINIRKLRLPLEPVSSGQRLTHVAAGIAGTAGYKTRRSSCHSSNRRSQRLSCRHIAMTDQQAPRLVAQPDLRPPTLTRDINSTTHTTLPAQRATCCHIPFPERVKLYERRRHRAWICRLAASHRTC